MNSATPARLDVLLVDDSDAIRRRLRAFLVEWPRLNVVGEAGDGLAAMALFERFQPHAVVLDIQLPGLSGVEVLRRIKAAAPECVVVMFSSFHQEPFRKVCRDFGADAFFHKATEFERVPEFLNSTRSETSHLMTPQYKP